MSVVSLEEKVMGETTATRKAGMHVRCAARDATTTGFTRSYSAHTPSPPLPFPSLPFGLPPVPNFYFSRGPFNYFYILHPFKILFLFAFNRISLSQWLSLCVLVACQAETDLTLPPLRLLLISLISLLTWSFGLKSCQVVVFLWFLSSFSFVGRLNLG